MAKDGDKGAKRGSGRVLAMGGQNIVPKKKGDTKDSLHPLLKKGTHEHLDYKSEGLLRPNMSFFCCPGYHARRPSHLGEPVALSQQH